MQQSLKDTRHVLVSYRCKQLNVAAHLKVDWLCVAVWLLRRDVSDQWLLGDSLLVSPVLTKHSSRRAAYFPAGVWHDLWAIDKPAAAAAEAAGSAKAAAAVRGPSMQTLSVPIGDVPLHVRGGSIVPMQRAASTTAEVRTSPVTLVVALEHEGAKPPAAAATPERCQLSSSTGAAAQDMAAAEAGDDAEAAAAATSVAAAAAAGSGLRTVACGQLYMDDGESLQVPPAAAALKSACTCGRAACST